MYLFKINNQFVTDISHNLSDDIKEAIKFPDKKFALMYLEELTNHFKDETVELLYNE